MEKYLNRPDVQHALHANVSGALPGPWVDCTSSIDYSRTDLLSSMLPVWEGLLGSGLEMLVYSGDVDAIVPVIGTRRWIATLGLGVQERWRPWHSATKQVGRRAGRCQASRVRAGQGAERRHVLMPVPPSVKGKGLLPTACLCPMML